MGKRYWKGKPGAIHSIPNNFARYPEDWSEWPVVDRTVSVAFYISNCIVSETRGHISAGSSRSFAYVLQVFIAPQLLMSNHLPDQDEGKQNRILDSIVLRKDYFR